MHWYFDVIKKYMVFNGRATRSEYWYFALFNNIITITLFLAWKLTGSILFDMICMVYILSVMLPALGVSVRRMHDTGLSGWWVLLGVIPFIGSLVLLVMFIRDSQVGDNPYGPDPKAHLRRVG